MLDATLIYGTVAEGWETLTRPGYFGRRRDQKIAELNKQYGVGNWRLVWITAEKVVEFPEACKVFYEESYCRWLSLRPDAVNEICSYGECIDNAETNIQSGCDYTKQESWATHIQDIAVRNVLSRLGRRFEGPSDRVLVIRSADSAGYRFGPGNIPFHDLKQMAKPSLRPRWAKAGSVEDFWQSNKFLQART